MPQKAVLESEVGLRLQGCGINHRRALAVKRFQEREVARTQSLDPDLEPAANHQRPFTAGVEIDGLGLIGLVGLPDANDGKIGAKQAAGRVKPEPQP